ncbi:MAG: DUF1801 domain-containing protein [Parasphingopyxis sp.]
MAENKTKPSAGDPGAFLDAVEPAWKRREARTICAMMARLSGKPPVLWGGSIIGFGRYHYKYESGREGDFPMTGFSPRKTALTLYVMGGFRQRPDLMERLGKYKAGKSCLYVKRLSDIDMNVLEELVAADIAYMRANYDTA